MTITTATILEHGLPFKEAYYHVLGVKQHDYSWAMNDESRPEIERLLLLWLQANADSAIKNEWPETACATLSMMNCILYGCIPHMIETEGETHTPECVNNELDREVLEILKKHRSN